MGYLAEPDEIERFNEFTQKLTALSKEYGFVLKGVGGVYIYEPDDPDLHHLRYSNDLGSQDLMPLDLPGW